MKLFNLLSTLNYGKEQSITTLLNTKTIYIAPLLNPDAAQYFFMEPKQERQLNNNPIDDDLDGKIDEDGPDDLNKDGLITLMRVKDQQGDWILDSQDPRLMRKVDTLKSNKVRYETFTEGIDNDRDGNYNEDPIGGVKLNQKRAERLFDKGYPIKKYFRGMSTKEAQKAMGKTVFKTSEGVVRYRKAEYHLNGWVKNFEHYLRNTMSYNNANTLYDFIGKADVCWITDKGYDRFNK